MKDNLQEKFPIVDEEGTVIGQATRGECHNGSRLLHAVVHLHVFNAQGDIYLQKRPEWKDIQPGKWDTAVGGHIDYGETPGEALVREVREELGITDFTPEFMGKYVFDSLRERELAINLGCKQLASHLGECGGIETLVVDELERDTEVATELTAGHSALLNLVPISLLFVLGQYHIESILFIIRERAGVHIWSVIHLLESFVNLLESRFRHVWTVMQHTVYSTC